MPTIPGIATSTLSPIGKASTFFYAFCDVSTDGWLWWCWCASLHMSSGGMRSPTRERGATYHPPGTVPGHGEEGKEGKEGA